METYRIPLVPGPGFVPDEIRAAYALDFGSSDLETEFYDLYRDCVRGLQTILSTQNDVVIQSGEGMLALWSALKSVIRPHDRVLAVSTGVFGYGIGTMAKQIGADFEIAGFGYDTVADPNEVRAAARRFRPRLVTAVHCETPSGTLNSIDEIGDICREVDSLLYVDFVASGGATPVLVDQWGIDLGLLGSQKVLSCLPDLAMVTVSERAWRVIEETDYAGYDALRPWQTAIANRYMPYTQNWHTMAALRIATKRLLSKSLENSYKRHDHVAGYCRHRLEELGVRIWPQREEICSPTVTAARVPKGWSWTELDLKLRDNGMAVGGSYGPLTDRVFRVGHMGSQADMELVKRGIDVLSEVILGQ